MHRAHTQRHWTGIEKQRLPSHIFHERGRRGRLGSKSGIQVWDRRKAPPSHMFRQRAAPFRQGRNRPIQEGRCKEPPHSGKGGAAPSAPFRPGRGRSIQVGRNRPFQVGRNRPFRQGRGHPFRQGDSPFRQGRCFHQAAFRRPCIRRPCRAAFPSGGLAMRFHQAVWGCASWPFPCGNVSP